MPNFGYLKNYLPEESEVRSLFATLRGALLGAPKDSSVGQLDYYSMCFCKHANAEQIDSSVLDETISGTTNGNLGPSITTFF